MLTSLASRLPGVYFETASPRLPDELPRMDIAAFVGFAASGPLHTPVPIESVSRFREIFGADVRLAWDDERGVFEQSWLGPAVEAFFAQGGVRCWVVRVADEQLATTLPFRVPGVIDEHGTPAVALARSPGAWPLASVDGDEETALALGTVLGRERFPLLTSASPVLRRVDGVWQLHLAQTPRTVTRGDLLEVVFDDQSLLLFFFVLDAEAVEGQLIVRAERTLWFQADTTSPGDQNSAFGAENPSLHPMDAASQDELIQSIEASPSVQPMTAYRLTFDMLAWRGARVEQRLPSLSFSAQHPRFWAQLPSDTTIFRNETGRPTSQLSPERELLRAQAAAPRFPFAGPDVPAEYYLPVGMRAGAARESATVSEAAAGHASLALDGLEHFDDGLFLDADLARLHTGALTVEAAHHSSIAEGRRGIYSLLPISEVSLIAVPDAVHRAWNRVPPPIAEPLAAPHLHAVGELDAFGRVRLEWSAVDTATRYQLEVSRCRNFSSSEVLPTEGTETHGWFTVPEDCAAIYYFRVRAERRDEVSAWSNNRAAALPPTLFDTCDAAPAGVASLVLSTTSVDSPPIDEGLEWHYEDPNAADPSDKFELQLSFEPVFTAPARVDLEAEGFDASDMHYLPPSGYSAIRYFRVRVVRGGVKGTWSNTVAILPTERAVFSLLPTQEYEAGTLIAVQRALMRLAAGRADAVALLSLPRFFHAEDVIAHLGQLLPQVRPLRPDEAPPAGVVGVPALTAGEQEVLTYSALYHPWLATAALNTGNSDRHSRVLWQPPDGHAAGAMAERTLRLGAWIAPANDVLAGVVSLDPKFSRAEWAQLTDAQVNLAVHDTRGFLFFNAETLSRTYGLRPLGVRRLMILLRRLALREGATFVFEPHSLEFRALIRQRFERLLSTLYLRGAFAGNTPAAGFRVVADETVNPQRLVEAGRFVVELRVAPSQPFRYLTVRLEQATPERLTVTES